jgi:hypothetical protein
MDDMWVNDAKEEYFYDDKDRLIEWRASKLEFDEWLIHTRCKYFYNDEDEIIQFQTEDFRDNKWVLSFNGVRQEVIY